MSKIKSINTHSRNYHSVVFDNDDFFILHNDVIAKFNLYIEKEIDDNLLKEIVFENELLKAKTLAYRFSSYKPRTSQEVIKKLEENNFNEQIVKETISFLKNYGLIDDERYVRNFAKDKSKLKKWGIYKIKTELIKKGIDKTLIEEQLNEAYNESFETENALKLVYRKLSLIKKKTPEKIKQSIINYLQYKGFSWEVIRKVLDELKFE